MKKHGLHKDPKKNFKVVNGQVVFNPNRPKRRGGKSILGSPKRVLERRGTKLGDNKSPLDGAKGGKKVNFFVKQNASREAREEEVKKAKEIVIHENILKDKRLMSKEDMIHLLEDSITRAFNPKDIIIKNNCKTTKSFLEKQNNLIDQMDQSLPVRSDRQQQFYKTDGPIPNDAHFRDRMDQEDQKLQENM